MHLRILHEPHLSTVTVTLIAALTSRINLLDLVNLNVSVFCKAFPKLMKL